jgi:hypothetical protein
VMSTAVTSLGATAVLPTTVLDACTNLRLGSGEENGSEDRAGSRGDLDPPGNRAGNIGWRGSSLVRACGYCFEAAA